MKIKAIPFVTCLLLVSALLFTSCANVSGGKEKSRQALLDEKINGIDTGIVGFKDVKAVCASFNAVFDDLQALGSTDGIYIDQLKNKYTGFYNTYQLMTEDANEAITVIGEIFTSETSESVAKLLLDADKNGAIHIDEDAFFDVTSVVSQDYASFTALDPDNSYFTAGKYSYADYKEKVEAALFNLNYALDYYNKNVIDSPETIKIFKNYFSDSLNAMADVARMHSVTLDLMSKDAETVKNLTDRRNKCLPG